MKTLRLDKPLTYTGRELAPHWIYRQTGWVGDALVSFEGPADVPVAEMVDQEDVANCAPIASAHMVHFLGEWFRESLTEGIYLQHLLIRTAYETLWQNGVRELSRDGDDIFFRGRKLSVSIATRSPVSVLVHTAFNVRTDGTPIPTAGLEEMSINPGEFAASVLQTMERDFGHWSRARCKVTART